MYPLRLVRRGRSVRLTAPEGTFSYYHPDRLFTGFGWDAQAASPLLLKTDAESILILGLGGGTCARQCRALFPRAEITGVDADARVVETAYESFGLEAVGVRAVVAAGPKFLRRARRRFSAIVDDMWPPAPFGPKPLFTERDWAALVASRLEAGGVYAVNLYGRIACSFETPTAIRLLGGSFPELREIRPGLGQTTVIAAGSDLRSPRDVRARIARLPAPLAGGLGHLKFLTVHTSSRGG